MIGFKSGKNGLELDYSGSRKGKIEIVDIKQSIASGCQIEYTRLVINNRVWYTFGFEWFGVENLTIDDEMKLIIGDSKMNQKRFHWIYRIPKGS